MILSDDPSPDGSPDSFIIASHCGKAMPAASSERRLPRHIQNRTETKIRKDWIICAMAKVELGVPMLDGHQSIDRDSCPYYKDLL